MIVWEVFIVSFIGAFIGSFKKLILEYKETLNKWLEKIADFFFSEPCNHRWYLFECIKCGETRDYDIFEGVDI